MHITLNHKRSVEKKLRFTPAQMRHFAKLAGVCETELATFLWEALLVADSEGLIEQYAAEKARQRGIAVRNNRSAA